MADTDRIHSGDFLINVENAIELAAKGRMGNAVLISNEPGGV